MTTSGADEQAFVSFVVARRPALLRTAYVLTGDHYAAEDLVQAALARTAMRWSRILAGGNPEPYVRRAIYHEHVSMWRRRRHLPEVLADQPADVVSAGTTEAPWEDHVLLAAALARLTPKQRAVLVLRFLEDQSESQTAAVLGCSVGTVKSQTRHALARLRVVAPDLLSDLAPEVAR